MKNRPQLHLHNRQRKVRLSSTRLQSRLERVLALLSARQQSRLPARIEISFLTRPAMARVHGEFLNDDSDTDVITFQHGEILVCPEVARRQARQHDRTTGEEVALYAIHGILHLLGFDHEKKTGAAHMERMQEKLLAASRSSRR